MNDYVAAILFFLPAAIGNATPVFANKIPLINRWLTPMDFGKSWRGKRLLGNNKTWRGLVFGALVAGLSGVVIAKLDTNTVVNIAQFCVGTLLGIGALLGDAIESFAKRMANIKPGEMWFPFDQLDYIFGGLIFIYPFVHIPWWAIITIIVFFFGLHLVSTYIGYLLGIRDRPI